MSSVLSWVGWEFWLLLFWSSLIYMMDGLQLGLILLIILFSYNYCVFKALIPFFFFSLCLYHQWVTSLFFTPELRTSRRDCHGHGHRHVRNSMAPNWPVRTSWAKVPCLPGCWLLPRWACEISTCGTRRKGWCELWAIKSLLVTTWKLLVVIVRPKDLKES